MTKTFCSDSPSRIVAEHAMKGHEWVHANELRKASANDADFESGLRRAHELGLEIKGYVPHHNWMSFLGSLGRSR